MSDARTLLRLEGIRKSFRGVQALDGIDLEVARGEVHALVGENGAGKSTLVKVIAGVHAADGGTLFFEGRPCSFSSPAEASAAGVAMIHQETSLIPTLTVVQNVFLGIERVTASVIDDRWSRRQFDSACKKLSFPLDAGRLARDLSVAEQKMTEILKAIVRNASFLIMDEPTDALSDAEIEHLFSIIRDLKNHGVTVLYITHYLDEVAAISDRVTVLRDGRKVGTGRTEDLDTRAIIRMMVGQDMAEAGARGLRPSRGREALRVEGLRRGRAVNAVSFSAYAGEILGIAGVLGSGKTELARLLFGADRPDGGRILVDGLARCPRSPAEASALGIGMVPEDRKRQGLVMGHEVSTNLSLPSLPGYACGIFLSRARELAAVQGIVHELSIRTHGPSQSVEYLSGGNQQKVVIGKWLLADKRVLIMDEPTRGIDVGTKQEIHRIMRELADRGACIIFISAEVPEITRVSDRILVMQEGAIVGELPGGSTQETVMHMMMKGSAQ